ncbi:MAG TPA: hypothetical protein VF592_08160 [Sphingomonas sp.]|jgi:predicted metalloprotease with PDZ domain|uniref:hypothetical protein n=1 Tax=Sphingomonas sp. TaxID=28214 RepID=UPI002ED81977
MRWIALLVVVAPVATPAIAADPIRYTVTVEDGGSAPSLLVEIAFAGDRDGSTTIELPSKWAGSEALHTHLTELAVTGGKLLGAADPARRVVRHRSGAPLLLRYRVRDAQAGLPEARSYEKARPVVERDWFYAHGEGIFAIPQGRERSPARFRWGRRPRGWRVASDLDVADPAILTANDAAGAILIGGTALRVTDRQVGGRRVLLAALGRWAFTDAELADRLARLIATENAMLSAPARPYVVTLAPLTGAETGALSYGGSGRTAGFALASTANVPLGDLTRLLAHEYAHRWFGEGEGWGPFADGAADYWFTEGFNDWFASRAMVRSGLWTVADWRAATDMMLLRHAASTARGLDDAQLSAQFWTNPDAMQVQYDRGNLTATLLDDALSRRGRALLATLAGMGARSGEGGVARLDRLVGAGLLARARADAAAALLPPATFGACGTLRTAVQPAYDRGFTTTADNVVATVRAGGPAWAAGVRPGLRFKRRTVVNPGDAARPYAAEFLDGNVLRRLSWLPEGEKRVTFQTLAGSAVDESACAALIG